MEDRVNREFETLPETASPGNIALFLVWQQALEILLFTEHVSCLAFFSCIALYFSSLEVNRSPNPIYVVKYANGIVIMAGRLNSNNFLSLEVNPSPNQPKNRVVKSVEGVGSSSDKNLVFLGEEYFAVAIEK